MSEGRGSKKNMELKKIALVIIFLFISKAINAEIIKPVNNLLPYDVLKIQLTALQNNEQLQNDDGIKQVWLFAHPKNKKITGPYERFRIMIYGEQYRILLDHSSHKINLIMNSENKYVYRVEILSKDKQLFFYEWHVEKGDEGSCKGCWFTSAVSVPVDQGNTI